MRQKGASVGSNSHPFPDDLTPDQKTAIDGYFNAARHFYGMTRDLAIEDFQRINAIRARGDIAHAEELQTLLFHAMHYKQRR
jgi:hypothetical protein